MRALITGATAFAGSHLADLLLGEEYKAEVFGIRRPRSREDFINDRVTYFNADITDLSAMQRVMREILPDYVFHLAAQSFVPLSWQAPQATLDTNINGTLNTLEAIRRECPEAIMQFAGSSEEYGMVHPKECPISEDQPLRPLSPYGASKVAGEMLCQVYHHSYNIKVVTTRAFNHTGPRRGEQFICSKIAKALAEMKLGKRERTIELGSMETIRDFTDVRDTVRAYALLTIEGNCYAEPFNIGSGVGRNIEQVLTELCRTAGFSVEVKQNPDFMRPADVLCLICDSSKVINYTGWSPNYEFEQTMQDLYDYWLARLS
jgi:GDP-4-dehydro-6-deoxy-D-mannose reductase